jgi:hypothetical protein
LKPRKGQVEQLEEDLNALGKPSNMLRFCAGARAAIVENMLGKDGLMSLSESDLEIIQRKTKGKWRFHSVTVCMDQARKASPLSW